MPFEVKIRNDLSLFDLRNIHDAGGSVMRTAHVGNVYPSNLAVASAGIRMNMYDRTVGALDKNYHPHFVICGGYSDQITDASTFTCHARVNRSTTIGARWFPLGESVVDGHMRSARTAIPQAEWFTYSDHLRDHATLVLPILELSMRETPQHWKRHVDRQGCVHEIGVATMVAHDRYSFERSFERRQRVSQPMPRDRYPLVASDIFGLTNDHEGWISPNVVNIVIDGMIEAKERGVAEVYHLSGPDMVRYIGGLDSDLDTLYDLVRQRLGWFDLPETLTFNLVPTAGIRFAVVRQQHCALEALVDAALSYHGNRAIRTAALAPFAAKEQCAARYAKIRELDIGRAKLIERLQDAKAACPSIFYRIADAKSAATQYDVLAAGGFFVHPFALETPVGAVSDLYARVERIGAHKK